MKNLKRSIVTMAILVALTGCVQESTSHNRIAPAETCLNGVVYYSFTGYLFPSFSPKFKQDSTVETCSI